MHTLHPAAEGSFKGIESALEGGVANRKFQAQPSLQARLSSVRSLYDKVAAFLSIHALSKASSKNALLACNHFLKVRLDVIK